MRSNNTLERTVSQRGRTVRAFALGAQLRQRAAAQLDRYVYRVL